MKNYRLTTMSVVLLVLVCVLPVFAQSKGSIEYEGKKSSWNGYEKYDFALDGIPCYVVAPKECEPGKPWVLRARFPNYHADIDVKLLEAGYHIAFINVANLYGGPEACKRWSKMYEHMIDKYDLNAKVVLEGVSRGGLIVYNWAKRNPDKVASIYCDTPVCDIRSWPGGKGQGRGSDADWERCMKAYGLTEETAGEFTGNPIDGLDELAKAGVPVMHVVSESDTVVPPDENTRVLQKRYRELDGPILVLSIDEGTKVSHGHHFPLTSVVVDTAVDFILRYGPKD
ncbi:Alpha/beta hydrolase family protein [Anaerohalosphaera lusitana]|uniref:Alpha/beta hydrolase family protein n=1 Tax=Anaerohalosphaera lusitana TaxID=1936003 RepID=A0A1U9NHQ8_9BACT|nr:alpha/beta hydrolase [Anaerohalosphaera lusitana]AQT67046.1 Alpha/beta hydrolase family protein [Anaerohalosphaera lusitana]